jgi:Prenyltransferase and squalene oxidase repeat
MVTRREVLVRGAGTLATLAAGGFAARVLCDDQVPAGALARGMITPPAQQAIDQGLAYLEANQHQDGSFGTALFRGNVAVTSLAGLAFMAAGNQPGRGRYGRVVTRSLEFILSQEQRFPAGFLANTSGTQQSPMYGHGFGTLFLAEAYGMVQGRVLRERLRGTLSRAVQLILSSQNSEGGWRYQPRPDAADISVTICQIMALRAARNAGFAVPRSVVDRCTRYVKNCQDIRGDGGFRYQSHGGPTGFARTAAGVVALYSAGIYQDPAVEKGLDYLMRNCRPGHLTQGPMRHQFNEYRMHYYYGHYYAVQAMWTAGGRYWQEWFPAIREELLHHPDRQGDGSWYDRRFGPHYGTAMACIILQIPNNYLPIFQR